MIFAGIDVNIITHEKLADACAGGDLAPFGLWTFGMCHAQMHETNGRLARSIVLNALGGKRNAALAAKLVAAGLWTVNEDGSWQVWNYGKKNQTAEEIREKKEKAAARVRDWRERRNASGNAPGNADVTRYGTRNKHVRTDPEPEPDNRTRKQDLILAASPDPKAEPFTKTPMEPVVEEITQVIQRRKPETACPTSEADAAEVSGWAKRWLLPETHAEFPGFLDHHRKSDARFRDWSAAWRTWLRNAAKFAGTRQLFGGARHVQSGDNRAWKLPPEMP